MKLIIFALFSLMITTTSWACFLTKGEIRVNEDKLVIHQKFDIDQSYPFRTENFLVHFKLLSRKTNPQQVAEVIIRHPKTYKILAQMKIELQQDKTIESSMESSSGLKIKTSLTYNHI